MTLRLTVIDSEGITGIDSTIVYFSHFGTHLGVMGFEINQGDSVFLMAIPGTLATIKNTHTPVIFSVDRLLIGYMCTQIDLLTKK